MKTLASAPVALITGITGQDGSYLAELLIAKGYHVVGLVRPCSTPNLSRIEHLVGRLELVSGDVIDQGYLQWVLAHYQPDEVYNLAAPSFVPESWRGPILVGEVAGLGAVRLLEAVRQSAPNARVYQASSSEMFGKVRETPQRETTPFYPRSPYGCAKAYAHYATVNYRESYGLFACSGIAFNHESPRRGLEFVTRKIARAAARGERVRLGNLEARRDWGYAPEYVEAMWLILQADAPSDYVLATGETHSVLEFAMLAYSMVGLDFERYVVADEGLTRPADVEMLVGDASKAARDLGWEAKTRFRSLVGLMVEAELRAGERVSATAV